MMLVTHQLTIGYGKYAIQKELNLTAQAGELICLTGTNGTGKSTLLRTIGGLLSPLSGDVSVQGKNIYKLTNYERATLFSLVLTDRIDIENMSVYNLVALGRFPYTSWAGRLSEADHQIVQKALDQVQLSHKKDSLIDAISDGEKQRAMIAKALAQDTPLVLLDEPTAHLDLPNRIEIMMLLRRLSVNTRKTFILSTHELDLALQMADKIWLMHKQGIQIGIPEDLMLSGIFQKTFGNNTFRFDPVDGHYTVNHPIGTLQVRLYGDNLKVAWVARALARTGIEITDSAKIAIRADLNGFWVNDTTVDTIEELLESLQRICTP